MKTQPKKKKINQVLYQMKKVQKKNTKNSEKFEKAEINLKTQNSLKTQTYI